MMYITTDNEIITGVYCGEKQKDFVEVPDTFNGYVGCLVKDFDSDWNLITNDEKESITEVAQSIEEPVLIASSDTASLFERIKAGLEDVPDGWKIDGDQLVPMNYVEEIQAGFKPMPEGYEIVDNNLVEIMTPEKMLLIEQSTLQGYLNETDWYVTRFAETGKPIPEDVLLKRNEARDRISEIRLTI